MTGLRLDHIEHADALAYLKTLPDECVNLCVTSPPYFGLRDYGTATWEGGDADCETGIAALYRLRYGLGVCATGAQARRRRHSEGTQTAPDPDYSNPAFRGGGVMTTKTDLADAFATRLLQLGRDLPEPTREYRFHPTRHWRLDFAWPDYRAACEIDGGVFSDGRHVRPAGYTEDCRKLNAAAVLGWRVLRFTGGMLDEDPAACIEQVRALLKGAA